MADQDMIVTIIDVRQAGKTQKFKGQDDGGAVREYTMSTTGAVSEPPAPGERVWVKFNEQASNNAQYPAPTYWVNEWGFAKPLPEQENGAEPLQETESPKKALTYAEENRTKEQSIEKQTCLKAAVEFWRGRPIEGGVDLDHLVTKTASHYYEAVFLMANPQPMHAHDGQRLVEDGDPGYVPQREEPVYAGDPGPQPD